MTNPSRVHRSSWLVTVVASAVVATHALMTAASGQVPPSPRQAPSTGVTVNPQAAALDDFQRRLAGYLALREKLAKTLTPLSPTPSSAELTARQDSLAAALRAERKNAKPGDLVPRLAARQIRKTVLGDLERRRPAATRAVLEEVPGNRLPVINRQYPKQAALPTVPALLLQKLPRLPDNLQYRFFGRHVVILDGDVQIIVDYITNALPPH